MASPDATPHPAVDPPARPLHVTFVCTGNICRSPMGHVILEQKVAERGLAEWVTVTSSGIEGWHAGDGADPRTVRTLAAHGYDGSRHRARKFVVSEFPGLDLVLASDHGHVRALNRLAKTDRERATIHLTREFDASADRGNLQTDDPWYGDAAAFEQCFQEVERACEGVVEHLAERLGAAPGATVEHPQWHRSGGAADTFDSSEPEGSLRP